MIIAKYHILFNPKAGNGIYADDVKKLEQTLENAELFDMTRITNYAAIAIKGLLFHYMPTNATITVDGVERTYQKVWLAPTMHGRYYGGGMIATPNQDRRGSKGSLSTMVFHGSGKLKTLMIFPSIFKGEHIKNTKYVKILTGSEIQVEFDRPTPLQIDGETITGVTAYTAKATCPARV